jgi:hypothetical protein
MKKSEAIFRGCSVALLEYFCKRAEYLIEKSPFTKTRNGNYFNTELVIILFHLTRVFTVFRERDYVAPRKNGSTKTFSLCTKYFPQELPKVKKGVKHIVAEVGKLLKNIPQEI